MQQGYTFVWNRRAHFQHKPLHQWHNPSAVKLSFLRIGISLSLLLATAFVNPAAAEKDTKTYGQALIVNVPFPEKEVTQAVQDVVQNGIIRGTKEYNKDEYVSGATPASSDRAFPEWTEGGKAFYKIKVKCLDPRNFKDSNDTGTLAVRYIVQAQDEKHTVLRIEARFVEDFRHATHLSDGSVENAEYKDIHDHLEAFASMQSQAGDETMQKQGQSSSATTNLKDETAAVPQSQPDIPAPPNPTATASARESKLSAPLKSEEEQLHELRQQVQRLVKAPGAPLKSAPFHTATTLQLLAPHTEVLVVISTPYWLGIETHDGEHGWMLRDDLEQIP